MIGELLKIAGQCDGVRCDMAMLVLPDVFERTWGTRCAAVLAGRRRGASGEQVPGFLFMAEVYWDLEWTLQQQGFDYAYDKRLYDRLREGHARPVREHLPRRARLSGQARTLSRKPRRAARRGDVRAGSASRPRRSSRFSRPACASFTRANSRAARNASRHILSARRMEPVDEQLRAFYDRLLTVLRQPAVRDGKWQLLDCAPAWDGNWTYDCFVAWSWGRGDVVERLIAVNYAGQQSQCYLPVPYPGLSGRAVRLRDLLGNAVYEREGNELVSRGLYLDLPPWGYHLFEVTPL